MPSTSITSCGKASVTGLAPGLLAAIKQSLEMPVVQGPPIEDDEEDYDEEEPALERGH